MSRPQRCDLSYRGFLTAESLQKAGQKDTYESLIEEGRRRRDEAEKALHQEKYRDEPSKDELEADSIEISLSTDNGRNSLESKDDEDSSKNDNDESENGSEEVNHATLMRDAMKT